MHGMKERSDEMELNESACSTFILPIHQEPRPGQRVELVMKNGKTKQATATRMHTRQGQYIQYFHRRKAVDINDIAGWRKL